MKNLSATLALAFALNAPAFAQSPPAATAPAVARTEEYCIVLARQRIYGSPKQVITLDYGEPRDKEEVKPQPYRSAVEALNPLNGQG